ncbi:MAG TPA: flagellar hook-length control protein FliK [Alphaproteobacteria bacterium]|nr:flagellar hook-length control protein FliK [Alphaproteobacteria bacterium]
MDSAAPTPDIQAKSAGFGAGLLSSISAALGKTGVDKLFADFLSQVPGATVPQPPPVPPPQQPEPSNQGLAPPPKTLAKKSQNPPANKPASDAKNASQSDGANSADQAANNAHWQAALKSHKPAAHGGANGSGPKDSGNGSSKNQNKNNQGNGPTVASVAVQANATVNSNTNSSAATKSNDPQSNLPASFSATPSTSSTNGTAAATTDGKNTGDAHLVALLEALAGAGANASTPQPPSGDGTSGAPAGAAGAAGTTKNGGNIGTPDALLSMLLLQLARLAAGQNLPSAANLANAGGTDNGGTTGAGQPATNSDPAQAVSGDGNAKADLKALLAALADRNNAAGQAVASLNTNLAANAGDPTQAGQAPDPSGAASQQSSAPQSTGGVSDAGKAAWLNATFLNLFNAAPSGPSGLPAGAGLAFMPAPPANLTAMLADGGNGNNNGAGADAGGNQGGQSAAAAPNMLPDPVALPGGGTGAQVANPYTFASQLSASHQPATPHPAFMPPTAQIVMQLTRGLKDGASQMSLQLQPEELGRIDIKLAIAGDGKVQGTVVASNPDTLNLLLKDVRSLERALQEAGLRADPGSLQYALAGSVQSGTSGMAGNTSGQAGNGGRAYVPAPVFPSGASDPLPTGVEGGIETYYVAPGRINLRV